MIDELQLVPRYLSLHTLFNSERCFQIPRYQRGFAWKEEQISDFVSDIQSLLAARAAGASRAHFFGSLVTLEKSTEGSDRRVYEVIDGQQRIVSFHILINSLLREYNDRLMLAKSSGDGEIVDVISEGHRKVREIFIEDREYINERLRRYQKLTLSSRDRDFYDQLVLDMNPKPVRESHRRLRMAWRLFQEMLRAETGALTLAESVVLLKNIEHLFSEDCAFIQINTQRRVEAYRLFCVLNNRGLTLSAGDLLRADTLEQLDTENSVTIQEQVERLWDDILSDPEKDVDNYLQWYYVAATGKRLKSNSYFDDFKRAFLDYESWETSELGSQLLAAVQKFSKVVILCRMLRDAEWPFADSRLPRWSRSRLRFLLKELGHVHCMPVLLAASSRLTEREFFETVRVLEIFAFRYKIVCNQHIGAATGIYSNIASRMWNRELKGGAAVKLLKKRLRDLMEYRAADEKFGGLLKGFKYTRSGSRKKYLRYLLLFLEDHWTWYSSGAEGSPKTSRSKPVDVGSVTLDHIYPQNPKRDEGDLALDELKHDLGNLTLEDEDTGRRRANTCFLEKKNSLAKSDFSLSRDVSSNGKWEDEDLKKRTQTLIDATVRVFSF